MARIEIRRLDDRLYEGLRARAAAGNRSISEEVVTIIRESLAIPLRDPGEVTRAMLELAGSWEDERSPG